MKVLVADDHPLIREALKLLLLELDTRVQVTEACDYSELLEEIKRHEDLDLVLLDLGMPGKSTESEIRKLCARIPDARIVVLSADDEPRHIMDALKEGASGFIPKSSSQKIMLKALELIISGGTYLPDTLLKKESASFEHIADGLNSSILTQRQIEVLGLLALGDTNKRIANTLVISEATVRTHVTAIFKALGASNRLEAVRAGIRLGLVPAFDH